MVIRPDDTIVVRVARSEMGQGTLTGLAQLVVEELEGDWSKVTTESITAAQNLARNRVWGEMGTGGSRGIRISQDYVRRGGAAARLMLLQAAADAWKVPVAEVSVAKGVVTHAASGRSTSYGKLAEAASRLTPPDPKDIKLKDPKDWTIAGKPLARLDTADKLNGSKVYAIDVRLPGMLNAAIKHCPVYGGKLDQLRRGARSAAMPGVRAVVKVSDSAVAVVADTWWRAKTALEALPIVWNEGPGAAAIDATIAEHLREGLTAAVTNGERSNGDALEGHRRRGEEGRGRLRHAVPRPCLHGDDELHRAGVGGQRRGLGRRRRTPRRRSPRCRRRPACRSTNARSTSTTSAAASAGAAARRTTSTRRSRSPSTSPTRR